MSLSDGEVQEELAVAPAHQKLLLDLLNSKARALEATPWQDCQSTTGRKRLLIVMSL